MKKSIFFSVFVMMLAVLARPCYSQQETQEIQSQNITGTVVSADGVGSKIVISTYQGDLLFHVPDNTVITRAEDTITLADIDIGDAVTVDYYKNSSGELETNSIIDSNEGNAF